MDQRTIWSLSWGSMFRAVMVGILVWTIYLLHDFVLVLLTAVVIASATEPITRFFMKYRIPRVIAVILLYVFFFGAFFGILYFFLPPLLDDTAGFLSSIPEYVGSLHVPAFMEDPSATLSFSGVSPKNIVDDLRGIFSGFSGGLFQSLNFFFGGVFGFILIIVISFYLSVQERGIENFLRIVVPLKYESYVLDLWARTQKKIGLWMQGQLLLGLLMGIFVYLGLAILDVPYALLLAVLAAVFELIPLFGPILAAVPAVILAFTDSGLTLGLTVIGFYIIMQQFENHLIYPLVVRKVIGVPPLLVIIGLVIFGQLFGFLGLILAVPAVTMILEIADDIEKRKKEAGRGMPA